MTRVKDKSDFGPVLISLFTYVTLCLFQTLVSIIPRSQMQRFIKRIMRHKK